MSSKRDRYNKHLLKLNNKKTQTITEIKSITDTVSNLINYKKVDSESNNGLSNINIQNNYNSFLLDKIRELLDTNYLDIDKNITYIKTIHSTINNLNKRDEYDEKTNEISKKISLLKHEISKLNSDTKTCVEDIRNINTTMKMKMISEDKIYNDEVNRILDTVEIYNDEYILDCINSLSKLKVLKKN